MQKVGAEATLRRYPGMGHTIHPEELEFTRRMLDAVIGQEK